VIVSHRYKLIFLKTNKTAGTSVEIWLSKHCGPRDIVAPISPADEAIRRDLGYRSAQNTRVPFARYTRRDWRRLLRRRRLARFYNHMPAWKVRAAVGPRVWQDYFKFCIERNPFDRVISQFYHWRQGPFGAPDVTFQQYLRSERILRLRKKGRSVYTLSGDVAVDRVLRYENLESELAAVADQLGLPGAIDLPRAKGAFREDRRPYREIWNDEDRRIIERMFAQEMALMGYEW